MDQTEDIFVHSLKDWHRGLHELLVSEAPPLPSPPFAHCCVGVGVLCTRSTLLCCWLTCLQVRIDSEVNVKWRAVSPLYTTFWVLYVVSCWEEWSWHAQQMCEETSSSAPLLGLLST